MDRLRRMYLLVAVAFLLPIIGAAIPLGAVRAADKITISMWFDTTGGADTAECVVKNVVDPFNQQNGKVTVKATMQPNGWNATRTALAGGGGPDVVTTPGPSWAIELASSGELLALDDFAKKYNWSSRILPWALNLGTVDGKLYSLASEQETMVLYYNKTLFEKHGWTPPKTIDEMTALAEKIKAAGIIPFAHGNQEWRPANHWYLGEFLNHIAGPDKVYDFLTGKMQLTDPAFVKAVDTLNQYQKNGWFMGGLERYYTTTSDEANAALGDGEAAMAINGTWFLSEINDFFGEKAGNSNDWGWVPVPSTTGDSVFDLGIGSTYSINAKTKHPDQVAEYLNYQFSPETQARLLVKCGVAPAPVQMPESALHDLDPRHADLITQLNTAAASGDYGYVMWTFFSPKTDSYLTENIEKVWAGDMSASDLLQKAQKVHDDDAAAGKVPPIPQRGS